MKVSATALGRLWGGSLLGVTIGIWGLDDEKPFSILNGTPREFVATLIQAGASVQVYEPGVDRLDGVYAAPGGYDVARDADVLLVFANPSDLREVDFAKIYEVMASPRLLDVSGALDPDEMRSLGFELLPAGSDATDSRSRNNLSDNVRRLDDRGRSAQHNDSSNTPPEPMVRGLKAKRALDLVLGIPLALAALPLIAVFAIGIAISFRCWPFFTQWRTGQDGKNFRFLKIRSLPPKTPAYANKFDLDQKSLPWLAGFLRKQHLDELPQLLLVPLGKMSLVGPRPKMPDDHEPIDPTFGQLRTLVPQGCTGLWQIGAHAHLRVCDSADYDYAYLTYGGVRFDLWILWRTALLLIGRNTPVSLAGQESIPGWVRGRGFLSEDAELRMIIAAAEQKALNSVAA
jgi:lipopolysaccharide/colanic/teichoic acid biosynthesis glycosyltransferase